jgi:ParB-like chromosome segregation protein Spo0J
MELTPSPVLPQLPPDEFRILRDSIAEIGVQVPLLLTADHVLVDGHERWRAVQELGITKFPMRVLGCLTEAERVRLAIKLNIERRHLSVAQRRELAARLLIEDPCQTDRKVAAAVGCDHKTVGKLRSLLAATGEIPSSEETVGRNGKRYRRITSIGVETTAAAREAADILRRLGEDAPEGGTPLRVLRKLDVRKRREEELNESPPVTPDEIKISTCDFRKLKVRPASVDFVLTDPPWLKTESGFLEALAAKIEQILRPGGLAAIYCGHFNLKTYLDVLSERLTYRWMIAAINADGSGAIRSNCTILTSWRPILLFQKGGRFKVPSVVKDVIMTETREKDLLDWQQPLEESVYLVGHLCPPKGLVCDPCVGSGTVPTATVLAKGGRRFVGCEIDPTRADMARRRVREALDGRGETVKLPVKTKVNPRPAAKVATGR